METLKKGSSLGLILFLSIAAAFCFCSQAKAAWYSTYSDVSNTNSTSTGSTDNFYQQNILLPEENGTITKIMIKFQSTAGDLEELFVYADLDNSDTAMSGETLQCEIEPTSATLDWYTCTLPTPLNITGDTILHVGIQAGDNSGNYTAVDPADGYTDAKTFRYSFALSDWTEVNYDIQVIYEIIPENLFLFYIMSPENGDVLYYDYEGDTTVDIQVACYSSSSYVAAYNGYDYLSATINDDWELCGADYEATLSLPIKTGETTITVLDGEWLDHSYDYYIRQITYQGVENAAGYISPNFQILWPNRTGVSAGVDKYEELYDNDADGQYTFLFRVANPQQDTSSWLFTENSTTLKIWQYDYPSSTPSLIVNSEVLDLNYGNTWASVEVDITTTPHFYKAELIHDIPGVLNPPHLYFWAHSTTTATEKNQGLTDSMAQQIADQLSETENADTYVCETLKTGEWNIADQLAYALCWFFIPDLTSQGAIQQEWETVKNYAGGTFLFGTDQSMYEIPTTTTNTPWLAGFKDFFLLVWLREILSYMLYFFTAWYIFRRIRNYFKN